MTAWPQRPAGTTPLPHARISSQQEKMLRRNGNLVGQRGWPTGPTPSRYGLPEVMVGKVARFWSAASKALNSLAMAGFL